MLQYHTWNCDIIPEDMQNIPVEKTDSRIVKIQSRGFESFILFRQEKFPDILTGKFLWIFILVFQEIENIVFIADDRTLFEVADFSGFFKLC